jgi:hypothetical protein
MMFHFQRLVKKVSSKTGESAARGIPSVTFADAAEMVRRPVFGRVFFNSR